MSKITTELLRKIFPNTPKNKLERFVSPFNEILPKYDITTKKRFAAFIANVGIESDRLKTTKEYGNNSYFLKYNNRKGLGNVREGDGPRYLGRSVLQTTGRYNYWRVVVAYLRVLTGRDWDSKLANNDFDSYLKTKEYSSLLIEADKHNVNFLAHPELLEEFPHAVEAAGVFVMDNNLNDYADKGQLFSYAGVLNTGSAKKKANHYNERQEIYELAMTVIPENFNLTKSIKIADKNNNSDSVIEDSGKPLSSEGAEIANQQGITTPPPSLIPVVTPVVEVEQISAAKDESKDESKDEGFLVSIGNKANAVYTAIATMVSGIIAWFADVPYQNVMVIMGTIAILGVTYMIINAIRANSKENRLEKAQLEREKLETNLKLEREKQAFELQKLTLESAMRKDLNTVRLVPPPTEIPNSDLGE